MKKGILVAVILMLMAFLMAEDIIYRTLPNGMKVAVKKNDSNNSVGLYCFVKTGSVNEGEYLSAGISHYLEHIVSGGSTDFHTEAEFGEMGREMGAIVNAFTTYDMTAFHITVDKMYADKALGMLAEQMQYNRCDSTECAREKKVILKEIVMRSSPAQSQAFQAYREFLYPNSNDRFPVIGYVETYNRITRDGLYDYYKKRYAPNNMVFVCVGNIDPEEMYGKIEAAFEQFPRRVMDPVYLPAESPISGSHERAQEFGIKSPMVFMSSILSPADYVDEVALDAGMTALFNKRKAPIRYKLVEELKLVNYVYGYTDINPASPHSTLNIGFEAKNPEDVKKIVRIIDEEIAKYVEKGFKQSQIDNMIQRYTAYNELSTPDVDSECTSIGRSIVRNDVPDTYDTFMAQLRKLTPEDIKAAFTRHILPQNRKIFYAMPKGTKSILESAEKKEVVKTDIEKIDVKKNITLIHKKNTEKPLVYGEIFLPINSNFGDKDHVGEIDFMVSLLLSGSKKYDSMDLTEFMEDHVASLSINAGFLGTFIEFKCLESDFEEVQKILIDALNNPKFPEKEIQLAKDGRRAALLRNQAKAETFHDEFRSSVLYPDSPHGVTGEEKFEIIDALTRDDLFKLHEKYIKADRMVMSIFGDIEKDEAEDIAKNLYKEIPHGKIEDKLYTITIPDLNGLYENEYEFEQVNVNINCKAPNKHDDDFYAFQVIETILNGSRGRLHVETRGVRDLAYFAYAGYSFMFDEGWLRLTSQTSYDKKDELIKVMKDQLTKLKTEKVSQEELKAAVEEKEKMLNAMLTDKSMANISVSYEAFGMGYDFLHKNIQELKKVTPEDIQRVAKKYFNNLAVFSSFPDEDTREDIMVK